jgi:uncharacterized protein YjbJ (UPF0337 family)
MDRNRVLGAGKQMLGAVKHAGGLVGVARLQADRKADQIEGKLQDAAGSAKDRLKDR